jgi:hypothetical protein
MILGERKMRSLDPHLCAALGAAATLLCAHASHADVTIVQSTSFDFGSVVHTHGGTTAFWTASKKREDTETHCEGMMSIVCGNLQSGEIIRLDKDLTWHLEPKQKRYRETPFATPEQLAAMRAQLDADLQKMKSCPASKSQGSVDKSKCEMSPPKFEIRKTGEKATIAGFNTEKTVATFTESCTDKQTGDVCDTVIAMEAWLSQDTLPGTSDRHAFELEYARKLGLTDMHSMLSGQLAAYLAPYQGQMSELTEKLKQLKGQPLRTTFRVMSGGAQCSSAKKQAADSSASDSGSNGNPAADVANAGKAVGQFVGNLFKKKKNSDDSQTASGADTSSGNTGNSQAAQMTAASKSDYPQMIQLLGFTTETTSITSAPVAAERFDVPADWTKEAPTGEKARKDEFTCPKTGS